MKQSDLNHLRRLLGWIRCDIGQSPAELQQTMIDLADGLGHPEISPEAKVGMVETYRRAESIPLYVRAAVKALEKALANGGPEGGAAMPRATAEGRAVSDVAPRAAGGPALPLSDYAMERGLAEVGITVWGPRAEDWVAGAEYAVRLMRECLPKAAAEALPDHPDAAGNAIACRVMPAAPPSPRRDDAGSAGAARRDLPASRVAAACKCSFAIRLTGDGCRHCQPQTYIDTLEICASENSEMIDRLERRTAGLEAARTAYASEFPPDENGDPVLGSIHANIRKLKGEAAEFQRALTDQIAECARADAQAAREVQRTFIYPTVLTAARGVLARQEVEAC